MAGLLARTRHRIRYPALFLSCRAGDTGLRRAVCDREAHGNMGTTSAPADTLLEIDPPDKVHLTLEVCRKRGTLSSELLSGGPHYGVGWDLVG